MKKTILSTLLIISISLSYGQWTQINQDIYGEAPGYYLGFSVSSSANGNIIAVGGHHDDGGSSDPENTGRVRILENVGGTWTQIGQNIDDGVAFWASQSPGSISLNSDGSIVAVGSPFGNSEPGFVRVYQNIGNNWTQIGADITGEDFNGLFGNSVSISNNGNILAVGAPGNNNNGLVRIYENTGNNWTQIGQDIVGDNFSDKFGFSVSMSDDGNIVAIGAPENDNSEFNSGQVRLYENIDNTWTQMGQDIYGEAISNRSGFSVSLNAGGNIVAIGAIYNSQGTTFESGHVRIYQYIGNTWTQIGQDIDGESPYDYSGSAIDLNAAGNIIAISAPNNDVNGTNSGHVRVYRNIAGTWIQLGVDIDGYTTFDLIGLSISLSDNGSKVIIGEPYNDGNGQQSGRVRIFENTSVLSVETYNLQDFTIYPNPVTTRLSIKSKTGFESITISDINGRQLQSITLAEQSLKHQLNLEDLSSGMYFIELQSGKSKQVKKIIKK